MTEYTVIYGAYTRFWPTLRICTSLESGVWGLRNPRQPQACEFEVCFWEPRAQTL
jgi:hypothetical protein